MSRVKYEYNSKNYQFPFNKDGSLYDTLLSQVKPKTQNLHFDILYSGDILNLNAFNKDVKDKYIVSDYPDRKVSDFLHFHVLEQDNKISSKFLKRNSDFRENFALEFPYVANFKVQYEIDSPPIEMSLAQLEKLFKNIDNYESKKPLQFPSGSSSEENIAKIIAQKGYPVLIIPGKPSSNQNQKPIQPKPEPKPKAFINNEIIQKPDSQAIKNDNKINVNYGMEEMQKIFCNEFSELKNIIKSQFEDQGRSINEINKKVQFMSDELELQKKEFSDYRGQIQAYLGEIKTKHLEQLNEKIKNLDTAVNDLHDTIGHEIKESINSAFEITFTIENLAQIMGGKLGLNFSQDQFNENLPEHKDLLEDHKNSKNQKNFLVGAAPLDLIEEDKKEDNFDYPGNMDDDLDSNLSGKSFENNNKKSKDSNNQHETIDQKKKQQKYNPFLESVDPKNNIKPKDFGAKENKAISLPKEISIPENSYNQEIDPLDDIIKKIDLFVSSTCVKFKLSYENVSENLNIEINIGNNLEATDFTEVQITPEGKVAEGAIEFNQNDFSVDEFYFIFEYKSTSMKFKISRDEVEYLDDQHKDCNNFKFLLEFLQNNVIKISIFEVKINQREKFMSCQIY